MIYFYRWQKGRDLFQEMKSLSDAMYSARFEFDREDSCSQIVIDMEDKKLYMLTLAGMELHIDAIEKVLDIDLAEFKRIDTEYFGLSTEFLLEMIENKEKDEIFI